MPMAAARRNQDDVAGGDVEFLPFGGDDAIAFGDDEQLIGGMHMPAIAGAVFEGDGGDPQRLGFALGDQILRCEPGRRKSATGSAPPPPDRAAPVSRTKAPAST